MDEIHYVEAAYVYRKVFFTDYQQAAQPQPNPEETERKNPRKPIPNALTPKREDHE